MAPDPALGVGADKGSWGRKGELGWDHCLGQNLRGLGHSVAYCDISVRLEHRFEGVCWALRSRVVVELDSVIY